MDAPDASNPVDLDCIESEIGIDFNDINSDLMSLIDLGLSSSWGDMDCE